LADGNWSADYELVVDEKLAAGKMHMLQTKRASIRLEPDVELRRRDNPVGVVGGLARPVPTMSPQCSCYIE